jgi:NitT/TauT family transport system ATP-binding protein
MGALIEYQNVSKVFFKGHVPVHALDDVSVVVDHGELLAIVGPSGCGKSTLLNLTAGLTTPGLGEIRYAGGPLRGVNRAVSYVTQRDTLLPWRTVESNVRLPFELRAHRAVPKPRRESAVRTAIRLVGLEGFEKHHPAELSGGMRKRAQLAQALVLEPDVLLMDEPFGALDAQLKMVMQAELLRAWEGTGRTLILVTHDLTEAITVADRVVVMSTRPGRIKAVEQIDLPRPRDVFATRLSDKFGHHFERLWSMLRADVEEAGR